jgi:alkanesulfonate monooxygenase SsuD/methylene tetrahydromethanopterin reductase-like flavin-dependent oxidoreductase (luciferase family)
VRFGLILPLFSGDPHRVLSFARDAEELGFDGVFAFDHFFPPGAPPDRPSLEAFTTLAAVSASTSRVTVGTLVTRAQLRPVGLLAKLATNLDLVSEGRLVLGIGTGDPIDKPEHEAFGLPMLSKEDRRSHLTEALAALKALFEGRTWKGGEFVPPLRGPLLPPPHRHGGPPIWVGAQADAVVALAGRLADGWNGWGLHPSAFARKAGLLAGEAASAGREAEATWAGIVLVGEDEAEAEQLLARRRSRGMPDDGLWAGPVDRFSEMVNALEESGATWVIVVPAGPKDRVELLANTLLGSPAEHEIRSLGGRD